MSSSPALSATGDDQQVDSVLDQLMAEGFVILPQALEHAEVERLRLRINHARTMGWEEGLNSVGNMWFDSLLAREPETFAPLVGHPRVRPYLDRLMGPQCQLRSLRAHLNPGAYLQEWHMDFYGYWQERRQMASRRFAAPAVGFNTTFYFQDNGPGIARLSFVRRGHLCEPPHLQPIDYLAFQRWCATQEQVVIHPKAGDCVLFFSHIPHQGAKEDPAVERSNVVCHYQVCPMHDQVWHVAPPQAYAGAFPLAAVSA